MWLKYAERMMALLGGGHRAAAGAQDDAGMESAKARILAAIAESGVKL